MINNRLPTSVIPEGTKWAFTTRNVIKRDIFGLSTELKHAVSGDLVLAQIADVGSHKRIQLAEGRASTFYPQDHIVLAVGDRYAPDQFEGKGVLTYDTCHLLAGGGVIGHMQQAHESMRPPTTLTVKGLLTDKHHNVINIAQYGLNTNRLPAATIPVIIVTGAAMNSGKTTAAVSLAHGLKKSGLDVAGLKVTGTGAFGDFNAFLDAGIQKIYDFTDVGMATTYNQPIDNIENGFEALLKHVQSQGAKIAVVELGDGLLQSETAQMLCSPMLQKNLAGVLFAAPDALSAIAGVSTLENYGHTPFAISGIMTRSPLAQQEFNQVNSTPVYSKQQLCDASIAKQLIATLLKIDQAA